MSSEPEPAQTTEVIEPLLPLSYANTLLAGVRLSWEQLGIVIGGSFLWFLSLVIAWSLGRSLTHHAPPGVTLGLDLVLFPVLASPSTAALTYALHYAAAGSIAGGDRLWAGVVQYTRLFLPLLLVETGIAAILFTGAIFYLRLGGIGYLVGTLCLYLAGAWLAFSLLVPTVLVAQEEGVFDDPDHKATRGIVAAMRRSTILFFSHAFLVFVVTLMVAAWLFLCVAFIVPFAILWSGTSLALMTVALRAMLVSQHILPAPEAASLDPTKKKSR